MALAYLRAVAATDFDTDRDALSEAVTASARIVFVGSAATHAQLTDMLEANGVEAMTVGGVLADVRAATIGLLIVELDGDLDALIPMFAELREAAMRHPLSAMALVPRLDVDLAVAAFETGVADVCGLPLVAGEVRARVRLLLRRIGVSRYFRRRAQAARLLAITDPVTQLYNRHYFDAEAARAVAASRLDGTPLSVLMVDIDALKPVNDRYGHAAGDRVLAAVAARLGGNLRGQDIVARFGGDEIAIAMPATDLATGANVARRLCAAISEGSIDGLGECRVTVSIGVATLTDADIDAAALLARADDALYSGKRAGRNRVEIAA